MDGRIVDYFYKGVGKLRDDHAEAEVKKLGNLRAGNSGLLESGEVTGNCPRVAFLRAKGIESEEIPFDKDLMFGAGRGNEDLWLEVLRPAWPGIIKCEDEIPVVWQTDNGTKVTGRPDVVLCDKRGKPKQGIELKLVSSVWTAREVLGGRPKLPHLIQAAHYSWQLGVPFELWYTSRVNFAVAGWMQRHFPLHGAHGSDACDYNDKGEIKSTVPFIRGFQLKFQDVGGEKDVLFFRHVELDEREQENIPWTETLVSIPRIKDYYEFVATMEKREDLGPRPTNYKHDGEKLKWSLCDYCGLKDHCDSWEDKGFKQWYQALLDKKQL